MRASFGRLAGLAALLVACGLALQPPAASGAERYIFELKKSHPRMMPAYRKIVPSDLKSLPWIAELDGVSMPVEILDAAGGQRFLGLVCQPHDCGDNKLSFLLRADGSRAVALLKSRNRTNGNERAFGAPDPGEIALLRRVIAE